MRSRAPTRRAMWPQVSILPPVAAVSAATLVLLTPTALEWWRRVVLIPVVPLLLVLTLSLIIPSVLLRWRRRWSIVVAVTLIPLSALVSLRVVLVSTMLISSTLVLITRWGILPGMRSGAVARVVGLTGVSVIRGRRWVVALTLTLIVPRIRRMRGRSIASLRSLFVWRQTWWHVVWR